MNFLKRIFTNLNITFSILLMLFIFYQSEIVFDGTNRNHYFKYYLFSFLYLIFSILIYKFSKSISQISGLVVLSIILTLYFFEFFYQKKQHLLEKDLNIKMKKYKELSGKEWDQRSQYEVYRELLKTDKNVVPYFYPIDLEIDNNIEIFSLAGVSNSLTIFCNENGYYSMNPSDRYGFNNPDIEWDESEIDYLFLGDSFTHGYCVNRPHDIPSVIRENYNQTVLNLGYGRSGPLIEYATLREYIPKNVKKIVLMYYEQNDIENLEAELTHKTLLKYLENENFSQNLKDKTSLIDTELRKYISSRASGEKNEFIRLKKTRELISQVLKKKLYSNSKIAINKDNTFKELEKILTLTKKMAMKKKIDFYFVYLPSISRFFEDESNSDKPLYFDEVKSIVNKLDINFIDINKEVFEKEQSPLKLFPFELAAHYNIEGYKKVADAIFRLTRD